MSFIDMEIAKKLSDPKNWTPELIYVHRTRLMLGIILGLLLAMVIQVLAGT